MSSPLAGPYDFEEPVSIADGWGFECSGQIYYGSYGTNRTSGSGTPDGVMRPTGSPWAAVALDQRPGRCARASTTSARSPTCRAWWRRAKFKTTTDQYDHHFGTPGDP